MNEIESLGLKAGQVSADENWVWVARCIGACGLAPAVVLDDEVQAKVKPEEIVHKINVKMGSVMNRQDLKTIIYAEKKKDETNNKT